MPITSIIAQPATNDLKAAYRPIVFQVNASRTDADPLPPVVYCDIYINAVYYKTLPKTQYIALNGIDSTWQFDISDATQEVLKAWLAANGGSNNVNATSVMASLYCKFRSSGYNSDGFITPEGTIPVQGSGSTDPTPGTGTQSNTFFAVNAVLQHEQNQDLASHLNTYKHGTWASNVFPLSHRQPGYKICNGDSDYFPIINLSDKEIKCLALNYKLKGDVNFTAKQNCPSAPCTAVAVPSFTLPDASTGVAYNKTVTVTGTQPITIYGATKPAWMTIAISGYIITFSGTPTSPDEGTNIPVSFNVANDCGLVTVSKTINVTAVPCTDASVSGSPVFPDATVGVPYHYNFTVTGTSPFTLGAVTKPLWMTVVITGSIVTASGTPTATGTGIGVSVEVTNCSSGTVTVANTISVLAGGAIISGGVTPTIDNTCISRYELEVTAEIGDSLTITSEVVHGNFEQYNPVTPETIIYSSPLSYIQDLANAAGQGYSRIVFTVVNNTTSITRYVTMTRNHNESAC